MKIYRNVRIWALLALLAPALALTSCKDDEVEVDPSRLFRPVGITATSQENTVTANWTGMTGASGYYVELYVGVNGKDDDNVTHTNKILVAHEENLQGTTWTVKGLEYATNYFFRVRANNPEPTYDSRFSAFLSVRTQAEVQVLSVLSIDADNNKVTFKWLSGFDVAYITIAGKNGEQTEEVVDALETTTVTLEAGAYTATAWSATRSYNTVAFELPILKPLAAADNALGQVTLRWVNVAGLERIDVKPVRAADDPATHSYNIASNTDHYLTVTDLQPFVTYEATIYYDDASAGNTITFTTRSAPPAGIIYVETAAELKDAIENAATPDGSTIALRPGTYRIEDAAFALANLKITKAVTLMAATGEQPIVECKGMQFTNTADIGTVRVENIRFDGKNDTGGYLFDHQASAGNVTRLEIVGCYVENLYNSVLRCDRATAKGVLNVLIDDCQMYNMNAKQCIVAYPNNAAYKVATVTITNSTIANIGWETTNTRFLSLTGNETMVLKVENNTLVTASSTNAWIDYRYTTVNVTSNGSASIKKNIIYHMNVTTTKYAKSCVFTNVNVTGIEGNNLFRAFVKSVSGDVITEDKWPDYSTNTADPQFPVDPTGDNRDFTVGNQSLKTGLYGDPRWLK